MVLRGVFGPMGSGKTLYAVWFALYNYVEMGRYSSCYSNVRINSPVPERQVTLLTKDEFRNLVNVRNTLIILDEAYLWLDSRVSSSRVNREISYLVLQSRKRGFDIIYTAQLRHSVDRRLTMNSEYWVYAHKGKQAFVYWEFWNGGWGKKIRTFFIRYENSKKYFPLYDTNEIVPFV